MEYHTIYIQPKLKGGSVQIGFLNANGVPSGNKNLKKHRVFNNFMHSNLINVFLETGCTTAKPKMFNTKWEVMQNNPAETIRNE